MVMPIVLCIFHLILMDSRLEIFVYWWTLSPSHLCFLLKKMHIIYSACYISTNLHISWGPHSAYSSKLCLCWSESNHHGPINFGLRVIDGGPGGRDSISFFKILIFISLAIFSLSDLWEKCSSSCPWHMLLFDCKSFVLPFKKKKKKFCFKCVKRWNNFCGLLWMPLLMASIVILFAVFTLFMS